MQTSVPRQALFRLPIGPDRTVVLPDDLLDRLEVSPGDELILTAHHRYVTLSKAPAAEPDDPGEAYPPLAIEGMLADYFTDHEDVLRFIEEERGGPSE